MLDIFSVVMILLLLLIIVYLNKISSLLIRFYNNTYTGNSVDNVFKKPNANYTTYLISYEYIYKSKQIKNNLMIVVNNHDYEDIPLFRIQKVIYSEEKIDEEEDIDNLIITSISKFLDVALWNGSTYYIDLREPH